jgi:alpha-D-ribose 1-methylphosphonate 5-triphosphate synthase subunit PhnL
MTDPILSAQGLNKTFVMHLLGGRKISALRDVSFDLAEGEFIALVGRTGAGKSTLLKCLVQIYRPDSGRVQYRDRNGAQQSLTEMGDHALLDLTERDFGYVSQALSVAPRVGALDLMLERAVGLEPEAARARARGIFADLALSPALEDVYPVTFSGGEKQRLNLALTLMGEPRMLFLDEPTAALDPETRTRIVDVLLARKRAGISGIGIFHDMEAVAQLADRVLEVDKGGIVAERANHACTF